MIYEIRRIEVSSNVLFQKWVILSNQLSKAYISQRRCNRLLQVISDSSISTLTRREILALLCNLFSFNRCAVAMASLFLISTSNAGHNKKKVKVWFYIALYPVRWTAQSALHFPPLADLFIPTPFSASLGSILAMQQLGNDYSLTYPPLSIARYSFIQLSRLRRREVKENAQTSKRYQRGFEPGLSRLRVRHSTN